MQAEIDALSTELRTPRGMDPSEGLIIKFSIFRAFDSKSTSLTVSIAYQLSIQNGS